MAASDYVPIFFKNRLHLAGRPQMSTRPGRPKVPQPLLRKPVNKQSRFSPRAALYSPRVAIAIRIQHTGFSLMARAPVLAAGGIVLQRGKTPLIAVVRLRKRDEWVLPKGKLDAGETPRDAAEREVLEETGHEVSVHEFLGTLVYETGGRSKIVHYWRMEAGGEQVRELMPDVRSVDWLPLSDAVERLSRGYERAFLETVGPIALQAAAMAEKERRSKAKQGTPEKRRVRRPVAPRPTISEPVPAPLQPALVGAMEEEMRGAVADEVVDIDAPACNEDSDIAVFAENVEPVSSDTEAQRTARSRNFIQRVRDWLWRAA
jgi:8-oxo-dGTP diphosphatase